MTFHPRLPRRLAAAVALALGTAIFAASPATAEPQPILYACRADTIFGPVETGLDAEVESTAPETVAPGEPLTITVVTSPDTVPTTAAGGLPLVSVADLRLVFPIPTNSTLVSATLSGGEGLGAEPVLTVEGDEVVVTLDTTLAGGAAYTLPVLTLELTAGTEGTIDFSLGGTSYDDPGLSLESTVDVFGTPLVAPTACYPNPNPVLSSTAITVA